MPEFRGGGVKFCKVPRVPCVFFLLGQLLFVLELILHLELPTLRTAAGGVDHYDFVVRNAWTLAPEEREIAQEKLLALGILVPAFPRKKNKNYFLDSALTLRVLRCAIQRFQIKCD